jgi:hypothetical protein
MFDQSKGLAGEQLALILACTLLLGSCATAHKPDLERLYTQSREVSQPPVSLIHGVMSALLVARYYLCYGELETFDFPFFLCESHETLTSNVNFQDNLWHTLLSFNLDNDSPPF